MANYDDSVAAASATANTNVFSGKDYASKPNLRHFKGVGFVGGNAINEAKIEVKVGGVTVGTFLNTKSGVAAIQNEDMRSLDVGVLPNELIEGIVRVAPTVSPLVWRLEIEDA